MAFDANGNSTSKLAQQVKATFSPDKLQTNGQPVYTFEQQINLKNGENYLYLGVWDMNTGQFGTIQLSLDATHPKPGIKDIKTKALQRLPRRLVTSRHTIKQFASTMRHRRSRLKFTVTVVATSTG
jgi:hypothetical protein